MMFKVLAVLLGVTASTTAATGKVLAPVTDPGGLFCSNYAKDSTSGSVDFAVQNGWNGTIDFEFQCDYWGDATSCDLDDWSDIELGYEDWTYRTLSWDVDPDWVNEWPSQTHTSGVEFFAWEYKIHVDDRDDGNGFLNGYWWNPGIEDYYTHSCFGGVE